MYQAQPYRRGQGREQTAALAAMLRGAPAHLQNPMDFQRAFTSGASLMDLIRQASVRRPTIPR